MKTIFTMLGEGSFNKTAFDFDVRRISEDAVCEFHPNGGNPVSGKQDAA